MFFFKEAHINDVSFFMNDQSILKQSAVFLKGAVLTLQTNLSTGTNICFTHPSDV